MLKRIVAYTMNILMLLLPIVIIYLYVISQFLYKEWGIKPGVEVFGVAIEVLCPTYLLMLLININNRMIHLLIPTIAVIELIILDSLLSFIFQGDLAKRILGLKVVDSRRGRVGFIQILVRTIIKYGTLIFIPIVYIYPLFSKDNKTLHDLVAKTKVINS